jgi:hypothetical protein
MPLRVNLIMSQPYDDGKRRYIGMYDTKTEGPLVGSKQAIYKDSSKLFDSLRETLRERANQISVMNKRLPESLGSHPWFQGMKALDPETLQKIIREQQEGGHDVQLAS